MTENEIIKLLKSGDFTIFYHDNGQCSLYKGKYTEEDLPEDSDVDFDMSDSEGYAPGIVTHLVKALNGNIGSI